MDGKSTSARLVVPGTGAKDQRWFVSYWAVDVATGKKKRIKEYLPASLGTDAQRRGYGKMLIQQINLALADGPAYVNSAEDRTAERREAATAISDVLTFGNAVGLFLEMQQLRRHSPRTVEEYEKILRRFQRHIGGGANLFALLRGDVQNYLDIRARDGLSNRSINNEHAAIMTLFNYCYDRFKGDSQVSPLNKMKKLKISIGRNHAFSEDEIATLTAYMSVNSPAQMFLCRFMYYTLARTAEIAALRIENFGMVRSHSLFIPKEVAKNNRDRHVEITPAFAALIEDAGILRGDKKNFVFSKNYRPGPTPKNPKTMPRRFTKILRRLGFGPDYTLYSWKHTGVVRAFKAGLSQAAIQTQMGHLNTHSFQAYIKTLPILENREFRDLMPELPR